MCESDDGQDDLMSRSTGMCESDQARRVRGLSRLKQHGRRAFRPEEFAAKANTGCIPNRA